MNRTRMEVGMVSPGGKEPMVLVAKLLLAVLLVDAALFIVSQVASFGAFFKGG